MKLSIRKIKAIVIRKNGSFNTAIEQFYDACRVI